MIYMENGGSAVKMYTNTPQALRLIFLTKKLSFFLRMYFLVFIVMVI